MFPAPPRCCSPLVLLRWIVSLRVVLPDGFSACAGGACLASRCFTSDSFDVRGATADLFLGGEDAVFSFSLSLPYSTQSLEHLVFLTVARLLVHCEFQGSKRRVSHLHILVNLQCGDSRPHAKRTGHKSMNDCLSGRELHKATPSAACGERPQRWQHVTSKQLPKLKVREECDSQFGQ